MAELSLWTAVVFRILADFSRAWKMCFVTCSVLVVRTIACCVCFLPLKPILAASNVTRGGETLPNSAPGPCQFAEKFGSSCGTMQKKKHLLGELRYMNIPPIRMVMIM